MSKSIKKPTLIMSKDEEEGLSKAETDLEARLSPLTKSILNVLNGPKDSIERLAFDTDPSLNNQYQTLYRSKLKLIPDTILKRIAIQDDLVASIVQARSNQMASFGRPRPDRFSTGYIIEPKVGIIDKLDEKQKEELDRRIEAVVEKLSTCGDTNGWSDQENMTFSQWLSMSTRNAIVVGRLATEMVWVITAEGKKKFHSFRPIDAGTIYRAAPQKQAAQQLREQARFLLEQIKNKKLEPEKFENDEYAWVQVIEGRPVQAFTGDECVVHNFYPVPDVELDGYPVTPIDTMIAAVTTHVNITTHNKIYFQTGRATRGMLVINSDDVDETVVNRVKQQFNASINSVNNAWRMPVFALGTADKLTWSPIDQGQRDAEFQYLTDMNARVILSAFQMSPEELPGWSYLSRGTNNQSLSEGNNEYKLEAARDLGIRPLISQFEDFINSVIFPLVDPSLAKLARIRFVGLDAETAEKESVRLQQDMPVHMTYDQVLEKVEKQPVGQFLGGEFPLNPQYQAILDKYVPVGVILERFFGVKDASKNPSLQYVRDPFWFQMQQLQISVQQAQQQAQAQAQNPDPNGDNTQQPGNNDPGQAGGDDSGGSKDPYPSQTENQKSQGDADASGAGASGGASQPADASDLTRSIDQALGLLSKSEAQLPPSKRRLLAQHKKTVDQFLKGWESDLAEATKEIVSVAQAHAPKPKR